MVRELPKPTPAFPTVYEQITEYKITQSIGTGETVSTGVITIETGMIGAELKTIRTFCTTGRTYDISLYDYEGNIMYRYTDINTELVDDAITVPMVTGNITTVISIASAATGVLDFTVKLGVRSVKSV